MIEKITPDKIIEYEKLDLILEKHMEAAELKCRKLNMGNIPWSPSYKKIHLEFDYWRMRYRYKLGVHRNVRQLQVLQNQLQITYNKNLSLNEIDIKIKDCYQRRKKIILMAESLSLEYRHQLAAAKEAVGEITAATYIRNLNRVEQQRRVFQNIRKMEDKVKGSSTNKVIITEENGDVTEYNKKEDMEKVIASSNEKNGIKPKGGVTCYPEK